MAITDETTRTEGTTAQAHPTTRDYPPPTRTTGGRGFTIGAFVCALVAAIGMIPILFGPVGMVLGYVGHRKGDPLGRWALGAAFLGLVCGMIVNALILTSGS